MQKDTNPDEQALRNKKFCREVNLLGRLKHDNIVCLKGFGMFDSDDGTCTRYHRACLL